MNVQLVFPELLLTVLTFGVLVADLFVPPSRKQLLGYAAAAALFFVALIAAVQLDLGALYGGLYLVDLYTYFFRIFFPATAGTIVLLSLGYVRTRLQYPGEYYGLVMMAALAMVLMTGAGELMTAYISLELLNFCLYTLAAYDRRDRLSNEAGIKYILLSILASALLLYGLSFIYGITGATTYTAIAGALRSGVADGSPGLLLGLVLVTAGVGFKVAAVPFHEWTPDVYQGAPTPITAFIAVASKAAGFALVIRLFGTAFQPAAASWGPLVLLLSVLTMTFGNLVALRQRNIKRLLAYSSIGQVGYLLMGVAVLTQITAGALVFHLAGYAVSSLAAFLCVILYQTETGVEDVDGYAGLAQRSPLMALAMACALFSLGGMPLFAGFTTKFYLFTAVALQGAAYLWLVALAVTNSLISLYYYLRVIRQMYIEAPGDASRLAVPSGATATLGVLLVLVFLVGLYPAPLVAVIDTAVRSLGLPL